MKYAICFMFFASTLTGCVKNTDVADVVEQSDQNLVSVTDAQFKAAAIAIDQVQRLSLSGKLQVNGILDVPPQNLVTVAAPMAGFVKSTRLLHGMKVKKGEALVALQSQEYIRLQQDYLDNLSRLDFLLNEYQRQETLSKENVNSQKVLQQAKAEYESTRAIVKGLNARLLMVNINPISLEKGEIQSVIHLYSPIDGFVTEVNINTGQFVNETDAIFKIVNLDHIHVELQVYEKDIRDLQVGQKVTFRLVNDQRLKTASVYLIGKRISAERTVSVHCHLDEKDPSLLPGMFVTATVETKNATANVVPSDAIVNFRGDNIVFVPSGEHQYRAVKVRTGGQTPLYTEIIPIEGRLEVGTGVVVHGAFELLGLLRNSPE